MLNERQVIAIVPTQANVLGAEHRVTPAELARVIELLEATEIVDLVVVSSADEALLDQAFESGAVTHEFECIGDGSEALFDLASSLVDGVDTFIAEESWVALVNPTLGTEELESLLSNLAPTSQSVTAESLPNPLAVEFFQAGDIAK